MRDQRPVLIFDDLTFRKEPVQIGDKTYELHEASEAMAARYRDFMTSCVRVINGQASGIDGSMSDAQAMLLSGCLHDPEGELVSVDVIRAWPSRIVKAMFTICQEISDLKEEDTKKAKNDLTDTEAGSS